MGHFPLLPTTLKFQWAILTQFNIGISVVNGPFSFWMGLWPMAPPHPNYCLLYTSLFKFWSKLWTSVYSSGQVIDTIIILCWQCKCSLKAGQLRPLWFQPEHLLFFIYICGIPRCRLSEFTVQPLLDIRTDELVCYTGPESMDKYLFYVYKKTEEFLCYCVGFIQIMHICI